MRTVLRSFSLFPVVAVLFACSEPEADTAAMDPAAEEALAPVAAADPAEVRSAIEAANQQAVAAANQGDIAGFVQIYTDDARIFPPDMEPIEGRQGIQEFWTGAAQQMGMSDLSLTTDAVEVMGDRAVEEGRFRFNTNQGPAQGKYIVVWERQPDGSWKWDRDMWNMSPPAAQ